MDLRTFTKQAVPTVEFNGHEFHAIEPDLIRNSILQRVANLEAQKLGMMLDLAEFEVVHDSDLENRYPIPVTEVVAPAGPVPSVQNQPVDLPARIQMSRRAIAEYDLRIGVLLASLDQTRYGAGAEQEALPPQQ